MGLRFGPEFPAETYAPLAYAEHLVDLGEVTMKCLAGPDDAPALLFVPGQTESWWGYEEAMKRLEARFRLYGVDRRGQGRSTRTPGSYTFDNMGNDLVRFAQTVIKPATIVCGLSSGGVLSAWLSAYAPPGHIRAALYQDPPLLGAEYKTTCEPAMHESVVSLMFTAFSKYLGDHGRWGTGRVSSTR